MNIDNLKVGDIIELDVKLPTKILSQKEIVEIHSIYPKFIVFDNGNYKFCELKYDLIRGETALAGF